MERIIIGKRLRGDNYLMYEDVDEDVLEPCLKLTELVRYGKQDLMDQDGIEYTIIKKEEN